MVTIVCIAKGNNISLELMANLISLNIMDYAGTKADTLSITLTNAIKRPKAEDDIKIWIDGVFYGTFLVEKTVTNHLNELTIEATSANFSQSLKVKRNRSSKDTDLHSIIKKIAVANKLKTKIDFTNISFTNIIQEKESDLHFLNRLATKYDAIFSIKNDTLIFLKRDAEFPSFIVDLNDCFPWSIEHISREKYSSCKVIWRDTKANGTKSIIVGEGEPILTKDGSFVSEEEAQLVGKAELAKSKRGEKKGSFNKRGEYISAGSQIVIISSVQDNGNYTVESVSTTVSVEGFRIDVAFTN